jgi:tetratricopeptide (TPR) repeat protein
MKIVLLLIFLTGLFFSVFGENSLTDDIADGYLDDHSKIEAAFILSGVSGPDSLQHYVDWYNRLMEKVRDLPLRHDDPVGSAKTVFLYLHSAWLKTYALESTTLTDIARNREYNCVAATVLYNIVCEDLGWSSRAFETPTHVYTIFDNFGQNLVVENTSTMGFNIMQNLKAYSRYLAQYYPESEVLRIGLDRLYYHENSRGRMITNTELLGLLAYNRAYLAKKNHDYEAAYELILLAQQFNSDSRSNVNFELSLYYTWGKELFKQERYTDAFAIFADGYYRYPRNEDFLNNTFVTFYRALEVHRENKNWPETRRLVREMQALEVLQEQDVEQIRRVLSSWLYFFSRSADEKQMNEVKQLMDRL